MNVNSSPVQRYVTKPGLAAFSYNLEYELEQARVAANISLAEYAQMPGTRIWLIDGQSLCKSDLLVWYRLQQRTEAVSNDIQNRHLEKESRKRQTQGKR